MARTLSLIILQMSASNSGFENPPPRTSPVGRMAALDLGERRIGVAVCDPLGLTVTGLPTIPRGSRYRDGEALLELMQQQEITGWLIGLPLNMDGSEGGRARKTRQFGAWLARISALPVTYWDERLTSVEAQKQVYGMAQREQARRAVDQASAVILLRSYLERTPQDQRLRY